MPWLIAILVAVTTGTSGLDPVGAILVGALTGLFANRMQRAERRIADLEVRATIPPLPEPIARPFDPAAEVGAPEPIDREAPTQPAPVGATPLQPSPAQRMAAHEPSMAWSLPSPADLERLLAGRVLAVVGGLALILGAAFFLALAFSRGWIGPELRVVVGLSGGATALAIGSLLVARRQQVVGHVLLAVGIAAVNLALFAATRLYHFVPAEMGLIGALLTAIAAAAIALRLNSEVIAAYGLVAVLAAPPVMGASATLTTLAFLGVALIGTTVLAVARDWRWLPPAAFVLTGPQLALYLLDDPSAPIALAALAGFWFLHAVAASGEEVRRRRDVPSPTSATVLLAAAGLLVWGGFELLDGDLEVWRGAFLVGVAAAHLCLGGIFVAREHDRHAFSLLAVGTGVAAVTMAVPIQLGGPPVPIIWAAEAAALAWVAAERRHPYSAGAALLLGALAIGRLVLIEYPLPPDAGAAQAIPFVSGRAGAAAFVLAAMAVAAWLSRDRISRLVLGAVGVLLVAYVLPFELADPLARMTGWVGLAASTTVVMRRVVGLSVLPPPGASLVDREGAERAPYLAATITGILAAGALLLDLLPIDDLGKRLGTLDVFGVAADAGTLAAVVAMAAMLAIALLVEVDRWRTAAIVAAAMIAAYAVPFDVPAGWTAIAWAIIGAALVATRGLDHEDAYSVAASVLAASAAAILVTVVMQPDRLIVDATRPDVRPLFNLGSVAVVAIAGLAWLLWRQAAHSGMASAGMAAAAVLAVYGLSVALVDLFAVRVGAGVALEELQKQAQAALSVLLAALGGTSLAIGLWWRRIEVRLFGLSLLALATAKVFLVDLATLDVAYRVLSFIGLGLLLLVSAWVVFRLQGPDASPARSEE